MVPETVLARKNTPKNPTLKTRKNTLNPILKVHDLSGRGIPDPGLAQGRPLL